LNKWTRVLLLQQLLVELIDLLDPDCIRITQADRRRRLMPVEYQPLPNIERYQRNLMDIAALGSTPLGGGSEKSSNGGTNGDGQRLAGLNDLITK
jgi:hypothetical protein